VFVYSGPFPNFSSSDTYHFASGCERFDIAQASSLDFATPELVVRTQETLPNCSVSITNTKAVLDECSHPSGSDFDSLELENFLYENLNTSFLNDREFDHYSTPDSDVFAILNQDYQ
jgi:hypothetical protein